MRRIFKTRYVSKINLKIIVVYENNVFSEVHSWLEKTWNINLSDLHTSATPDTGSPKPPSKGLTAHLYKWAMFLLLTFKARATPVWNKLPGEITSLHSILQSKSYFKNWFGQVVTLYQGFYNLHNIFLLTLKFRFSTYFDSGLEELFSR